MPLTKDQIATNYPLPAYNYRVTVEDTEMAFSEVSGLSKNYEKVVYKHGYSFMMGVNIIRSQATEIAVTFRRGVVAKRSALYDWFTDSNWLTREVVKDITIDLCNEMGDAVVRWKIYRALPIKLEAPGFNAGDNNIAIESIEVVAEDISIEYL